MRWIVLAATVCLLVPGCFSTSNSDPDSTDVAAEDEWTTSVSFGPETGLPGTVWSGEPNIAALSDGTLFVTAPVGYQNKPNMMEGAAYLWRSQDGGATWQIIREPNLVDPPPVSGVSNIGLSCSCDADVVTSDDDWVYYTDWYDIIATGNFVVEASGDGGNTWSSSTAPVLLHSFDSLDRQWLLAGPAGFVGLIYSIYSDTASGTSGHRITGTFSHDYGETWGGPIDIVPLTSGWGWQIGHPSIHHDGTLMMAYGAVQQINNFWTDPSEVRVVTSTDKGSTWVDSTIAQAPEGFGNLWAVQGASGDDLSAVVWAAHEGKQIQVWSSSSTDLVEWTNPVRLSPNGTHVLPWITVADVPYAVWYGGPTTGDPKEATDGEWHLWISRIGAEPMTTQVTAKPVKTGPFCPIGAACPSDRELLDYASLTASDGGLQIAFARSSDGGGSQIDGAQAHHITATYNVTKATHM